MIVVADTSPLNYLILINEVDLLPCLYKTVVIPPAVVDEMRQPDTPKNVQAWIDSLPDWLIIKDSSLCLILV